MIVKQGQTVCLYAIIELTLCLYAIIVLTLCLYTILTLCLYAIIVLTLCLYAIIQLALCLYAIIVLTLCLYAIIVLTFFLSLGRHLTLAVYFAPVPDYSVLCNFLFEFQLMNSRSFSKAACLVSITFSRCCSWKIQTHKRWKRTLFIRTKTQSAFFSG